MHRSTNRAGRAHEGTGSRHAGHDPAASVGYELTGAVRWLDTDLQRVVLHVHEAGAQGGAFVGEDVTVDLGDAAVHGAPLEKLLPGTHVRVKFRLPRDHTGGLPELIRARSAYPLDA